MLRFRWEEHEVSIKKKMRQSKTYTYQIVRTSSLETFLKSSLLKLQLHLNQKQVLQIRFNKLRTVKIACKVRGKIPLFWAHKISLDLEVQLLLLADKTNQEFIRTKITQNRGRVCLLESLSTFLSKDSLAKNVSLFRWRKLLQICTTSHKIAK